MVISKEYENKTMNQEDLLKIIGDKDVQLYALRGEVARLSEQLAKAQDAAKKLDAPTKTNE